MPKTPTKASPAKTESGQKRRMFGFLRSPLRKSSQKVPTVAPSVDAKKLSDDSEPTTIPEAVAAEVDEPRDAAEDHTPSATTSDYEVEADDEEAPKEPAISADTEPVEKQGPVEVTEHIDGPLTTAFMDDAESDAGLSYVSEPDASTDLAPVVEYPIRQEENAKEVEDAPGIGEAMEVTISPDIQAEPKATAEEENEGSTEDTDYSSLLEYPLAASATETDDSEMSTEAAKRNYVFAHFMVGNTYPYTVDDWYADIKLAASHGIDGFVLNVGREGWQKQRSIDCFAAAKRLPESTSFKFFFSFDMTSIPGGSAGDVQLFRDYLSATSKSARMFRHPRTNGVVVSTFSGENSNFGQGNLENGWQYLKNELNKIVPVYFIPSFFISPARYRSIPAMDGAFNWNGGWPLQLNPWTERSQVVNAKLDSDYSHLENLTDGRTFMAAVSPWFFTHYGPNTWNKNWIYRGDDWLFVRRWEQLIEMRDSIDMAQIISWNDYGESHYIGPIKGAQPNSQAWVDGFPHEAWMTLNQYYAKAFQTGKYPIIEKERIFMWVRPHPKDASSPDSVPRPDNWQLTDDTAWVVVFANKPGSVTLSTQEDESDKTTHQVNPGVTKLSFPVKVGQGMKATLYRDNKAVVTCYPRDFRFNGQPPVYNFNAYVTMSP